MTPQQATEKYHWCKYIPEENTVELYLDHYMLSGLRLCEARFYLDHLLWVKPKYTSDVDIETDVNDPNAKVIRKPWFLDFGEYVHWCIEQFYKNFKINKVPPAIDSWLDQCKMRWALMRMDDYQRSVAESDIKKYNEVHGWEGICGLLTQYYVHFMDMRLRVVDTEITFGHNKEVFIGRWETERFRVNCYLTGRIDLLVDNGYKIGPVDHKTTHRFDGFEHQDFNPHDGLTGYILAIHEILKKHKYVDMPACMGGWIYHISACTPAMPNKESRAKGKKQGPRFKTTPVDKTLSQLEDFKARQLSSFKRVAELLFNDKVPEWNTTTCNNIFFRQCEYKPIHEQPSEQWPDMINRFYQIASPWDTRLAGKEKEHAKKESGV